MSALAREQSVLADEMAGADRELIAGHSFRTGTIGDRAVVLTAAGVGKVNAALVATLAMDHFQPGAVLFTGVAGGIDETLHIGDVVVGEHVVHHDTGVLEPEGLAVYQSGHIPFFNPTNRLGYRPSSELLHRARAATERTTLTPVLGRLPRVVFGTIVTGDQFIHAESERLRLAASMRAQAVEMEGASVAQVAEHFGVDHLVIRALSDLAGRDSPIDFARFLDEVAANSSRLVLGLLDAL